MNLCALRMLYVSFTRAVPSNLLRYLGVASGKHVRGRTGGRIFRRPQSTLLRAALKRQHIVSIQSRPLSSVVRYHASPLSLIGCPQLVFYILHLVGFLESFRPLLQLPCSGAYHITSWQ